MPHRAVAFGGHGYGHRAVAFRGWFISDQQPAVTYWYSDTGIDVGTPERELESLVPLRALVSETPIRLVRNVTKKQGIINATPEP